MEELPGLSKVAGKKISKKIQKNLQGLNHALMVEIDSTPSNISGAPKSLKFECCNLDLQKSMADFIKILPKFP